MPIFKTDLPRSFPKGSELTNSLVNAILRELWRWRRIQATAPLTIDYAESDQPPILSYVPSQYVNIAWGNTGTGFTAATGTPPVPTSNTSIQLYKVAPGNPPVLSNWQTVTAWNPYAGGSGVASSKTALFGQTTDGTWWVITADC